MLGMTLLLVSKSCMINGMVFHAGDEIQYEGEPQVVFNFFITRKPIANRPKMFQVRHENRNNTLGILVEKQSNNKKAMTIRNRMALK